MPSSPPSQCNEFGCKSPTAKGSSLCLDHAPCKMVSDDRKAFNNKYKKTAWEKIRSRQFSTIPLCQACLLDGRVNQASHVDHLFPWKRIGEMAFRRNLFQSLCPECHGVKSGLEKRGVIRHYGKDKIHDYCLADYLGVLSNYENST